MSFLERVRQWVSGGAAPEERRLRERLEELERGVQRAELRRRLDTPAAVQTADLMRARCAELVRSAIPGEDAANQLYSRHALFDVHDDVARDLEALAPLECAPPRRPKTASWLQ